MTPLTFDEIVTLLRLLPKNTSEIEIRAEYTDGDVEKYNSTFCVLYKTYRYRVRTAISDEFIENLRKMKELQSILYVILRYPDNEELEMNNVISSITIRKMKNINITEIINLPFKIDSVIWRTGI